ncbi:MAG: ABC transporter substrate-binding protein [Pseudomonadota bacterium]
MKTRKSILLAGVAAIATTGAAQAEISNGKIVLGLIDDMSAIYADITGEGNVVAMELAIADAKEKWGDKLGDVEIELITADHQNKADVAATTARQWIDEEGVDFITGGANSATGLAVQEVTRQAGVAYFNTGSATVELTNSQCSPTGIHWPYDTYALAQGTGKTMVEQGLDTWFFITADYAFGHSLEETTTQAVEEAGGTVVGGVRAPFPNNDFSSFLLEAQASGAKVIGMANAGGDTINTIKQANEFGITASGQTLAGLLMFITDIDALGLEITQGLTITSAWYWDYDDQTRAFTERFKERRDGRVPSYVQAGTYSATLNYLRGVAETGSDDGKTVVDHLKTVEIEDMFARNGYVREDGRMVHDMLLVQVKSPDESSGRWDYFNIVTEIPGDEAFMPLEESRCEFVNN